MTTWAENTVDAAWDAKSCIRSANPLSQPATVVLSCPMQLRESIVDQGAQPGPGDEDLRFSRPTGSIILQDCQISEGSERRAEGLCLCGIVSGRAHLPKGDSSSPQEAVPYPSVSATCLVDCEMFPPSCFGPLESCLK